MVGKHEPLQLEEALDSSKLTTIVHPHSSSSKRELTDAYLTIKRAGEEISMVAMEMTYTRQHYVHEISAVQNCNQQYSKKKMHSVGEVFHSFMVLSQNFAFVLVKSMIYFLSLVTALYTTSMPVIPGGNGSDSDEEVLVKD